MTKLLIFIFVLISTPIYAQPAISVLDKGGNVLDITLSGGITATNRNSADTATDIGAPSIRIIDKDGDTLDINSDGSVNVTFN